MSTPTTTTTTTTKINNHLIEIAVLKTINYTRLLAKEPSEIETLLQACQFPGFFYLDFREDAHPNVNVNGDGDGPTTTTGDDDGDGDGPPTLTDLKEIYGVAERFFDQPGEVKARSDGYKKAGGHGEAFEFTFDALKSAPTKTLTPLESPDLITRFSTSCDTALHTLLTHLTSSLPPLLQQFNNIHRRNQPSESSFMLFYGPTKNTRAEVPDNQHTDEGSLTLMFCEDWSVQLCLPEPKPKPEGGEHEEGKEEAEVGEGDKEEGNNKKWVFVPPKHGCAIVNVADGLQRASGGRFVSCRHRVTQPVDGMVRRRWFVVVYLRPGC